MDGKLSIAVLEERDIESSGAEKVEFVIEMGKLMGQWSCERRSGEEMALGFGPRCRNWNGRGEETRISMAGEYSYTCQPRIYLQSEVPVVEG